MHVENVEERKVADERARQDGHGCEEWDVVQANLTPDKTARKELEEEEEGSKFSRRDRVWTIQKHVCVHV